MEVYFDKLGLLSENIENEALLKVCDVRVGHSDLEHRDGKYHMFTLRECLWRTTLG